MSYLPRSGMRSSCCACPNRLLHLLAGAALLAPTAAFAQKDPLEELASINWQKGPATVQVGSEAELKLDEGYIFADAAGTRKFLELNENPTDGSEVGLLAPEDMSWFVTFEFSDIGYVKDEERDKLDANAIMDSIRAGNEEGNKERKRRGWPPVNLVGWEQPPRYDTRTNSLVWATRAESQGEQIVNYNTRRLGRAGVMRITLVVEPEELDEVVPTFESAMNSYAFVPGHRYNEFRSGDKIAKYGLTALITGGAAAVAVKTGMFKWLWKLIVAGIVGVGVVAKKIFRRG